MDKVWDVKRPKKKAPKDLDIHDLIVYLWLHDVTIEHIFSVYYQLEQMGLQQRTPLTVGDAELAGLTEPKNTNPKPF